MSLRSRQTDILRLSFDAFLNETGDSSKAHFEWAIDHESQQGKDWCWAACLSNALSCVGTYVNQDEIVDRFRNDLTAKLHFDLNDPPGATDQRIPTPRHVIDLWKTYGFERARFLDEPLTLKALMDEIVANGPVQIELWSEETPEIRHLALVFGLRETSNAIEVGVSDPLANETVWLPYADLTGTAPLIEKFGAWRRTYVDLGYQKGYLRRFQGRPSRFLAGLPEEETTNGSPIPTVTAVASQLKLERPPHRYPPLPNELSIALYGYRHYRYSDAPADGKDARRADLRTPLFLFESIPICRAPYEIDRHLPLRDQVRPYRWHHQVHNADGPRYYAEAWFFPKLRQQFDRAWRTAWIGERWKARRVDDAIRRLDANFKDLQDTVLMVQFRRHGLVTLLLPDSGIHMIVDAHKERQEIFPLLETRTDEEIREAIAKLGSGTTTQPFNPL